MKLDLLIGPPISVAIIAPRTIPSKTRFPVPKDFKNSVTPLFNVAIGSTINPYIKAPVINIPNNGYKRTGFNPSKLSGSLLNNFLRRTITYPPRNPPISPPKNPPPLLREISPPTIAGANPGLSAILIPINPAITGTIKKKAFPPPISLRSFAIGLKLGSFGLEAVIPNINERAIKIPPPTTNGNILETPDIRCL